MFDLCLYTTKHAMTNSVRGKYKSNVIAKSGDSLNKGIKESNAAIKKMIIEERDTNLDNFNKTTYKTRHIKKIYMHQDFGH